MCLPVQETIKELDSTFETSESLPSTKTERCRTGYFKLLLGSSELLSWWQAGTSQESGDAIRNRKAFPGYELSVTSWNMDWQPIPGQPPLDFRLAPNYPIQLSDIFFLKKTLKNILRLLLFHGQLCSGDCYLLSLANWTQPCEWCWQFAF